MIFMGVYGNLWMFMMIDPYWMNSHDFLRRFFTKPASPRWPLDSACSTRSLSLSSAKALSSPKSQPGRSSEIPWSWWKQGGPENPKARRHTAHFFKKKTCGVGSCALHEIGVRSLLKHRAHWWYQGPQFTTACCVSYVYILLVAIFANVINSIPSL